MIEFTCPGCQSPHKANEAFAGRRAKCVRCGATLHIPHESGEATFAQHASLETDEERDERIEKERYAEEQSEGVEDGGDSPRKGNALLKRFVAAGLLLLLIAGAIYFLYPADKPAVAQKVAPPIQPDTPPVVEAPAEVPLPPAPVVKIDPIVITADRLGVELISDQKGCSSRYEGRFLQIHGICLSLQGRRMDFLFAHAPNSVELCRVLVDLEDYYPKFEMAEDAANSVLGAMAFPTFPGSPLKVTPRMPVVVQGYFKSRSSTVFDVPNITRGKIVGLNAQADPTYLGKTISVVGTYSGFDGDQYTTKFLPADTTSHVELEFRFTKSTGDAVQRTLKVGQIITLTGKCIGRYSATVLFENTQVSLGGTNATPAMKVIADYEADLFPYPPILPNRPVVKVTAAELAQDYKADAKKADEKYADRFLELTGVVLPKGVGGNTVRFETTTDTTTMRVEAAFTKAEFERIPKDEPQLTIRGEFRGSLYTKNPSQLKLENAYVYDPDLNDPAIQKLTADFFPLRGGREWQTIRVVYPDPPPKPMAPPKAPIGVKPKPEKPLEHPVQRLHYRTLDDGRVQVSLLHLGGTTGDSLFQADAPDVKWIGKPAKANSPQARALDQLKYRTTDRFIELGTPKNPKDETPAPPPIPGRPIDPLDARFNWQPFVKLGSKAGKSWEYSPSVGVVVKTSVESFGKDAKGRETAKIVAVVTDEKFADRRMETAVVLAKGLGEVSRVVTQYFPGGKKVVLEEAMDGEAIQNVPITYGIVLDTIRNLNGVGRTAVRRVIPAS